MNQEEINRSGFIRLFGFMHCATSHLEGRLRINQESVTNPLGIRLLRHLGYTKSAGSAATRCVDYENPSDL